MCEKRASKRRGTIAGYVNWELPLPDADVEHELARVLRLPLGPEAERESRLVIFQLEEQPLGPQSGTPSSTSRVFKAGPLRFADQGSAREKNSGAGSPSALLLLLRALPLLARIIDMVAGVTPVLCNIAATSSRWFCASHLVRIAGHARRLECLDRALRFCSHPDFRPADITLGNVAVNLENATDLPELEEEELRDLMLARNDPSGVSATARAPPLAVKMAASAMYEILCVGRPEYSHFDCSTGMWPQDRRIMEPVLLEPLLMRFQRHNIPQEVLRRVRATLCSFHQRLTPAAVLSGDDEEINGSEDGSAGGSSREQAGKKENAPWRPAAACLLQWVLVQLAHEELEDSFALELGVLEKAVLLQPSLAARRIQRRRQTVLDSLQFLRLDPLNLRLLSAPLERQLPAPKRRLVNSPPARASSTSRLPARGPVGFCSGSSIATPFAAPAGADAQASRNAAAFGLPGGLDARGFDSKSPEALPARSGSAVRQSSLPSLLGSRTPSARRFGGPGGMDLQTWNQAASSMLEMKKLKDLKATPPLTGFSPTSHDLLPVVARPDASVYYFPEDQSSCSSPKKSEPDGDAWNVQRRHQNPSEANLLYGKSLAASSNCHRSARGTAGSAEARALSPQSLQGGGSRVLKASTRGEKDVPPELSGSVREALGLPKQKSHWQGSANEHHGPVFDPPAEFSAMERQFSRWRSSQRPQRHAPREQVRREDCRPSSAGTLAKKDPAKRQPEETCTPTWRLCQRPGSAPAGLPWSSPGLRFCTPLRA